MKEYIEREAFITNLYKQAITDGSYGIGIARGLEIAENIAKRMPYREIAADVVEVVRCKDCVRFDKKGEFCGGLECSMSKNDFCSYGEKRGEGDE